ncbi:helix-turn-helix transcriptional regulator [Castellaniella defragrans]|uniref:helix-turn-helix transcriptional regulator n=1 Tax=Castellaniella defragrans TaxID=75697 RepID=UPI0023F3251F|nr:AlpA family transcriptional regulator [Castellaniella defragrans]
MQHQNQPVTLLRLPAVMARIGYGRSKVYDMIGKGEFPAPIKMGARTVAWPSDQIDAWIAQRIQSAQSI